jgi:phosphoribosylpyrophosphate synthetase
MVSVDLHSNQLQGFFEGPWDHLVAMPVLCDALGKLADDLVVVSPDAGRVGDRLFRAHPTGPPDGDRRASWWQRRGRR